MPAIGAAVAACVSLRQFRFDCQDGGDKMEQVHYEFDHYVGIVGGLLQEYETVSDRLCHLPDVQKTVHSLIEYLVATQNKATGYREAAHSKPVRELLFGSPTSFWEEATGYLWTVSQDKWADIVREQVEAKRLEDWQKETVEDQWKYLDNIEQKKCSSLHLQAIIQHMSRDDHRIFHDMKDDKTLITVYMGKPIIKAIVAERYNEISLLIGSQVSVGHREGKVVDHRCSPETPWMILYDDSLQPIFGWVARANIAVIRWGPQLRALQRIMEQVSDVPVFLKETINMIRDDPSSFFRYYQHEECLVQFLRDNLSEKARRLTKASLDCHVLFLGNPGAGKSTLLNCLMGEDLEKDKRFTSATQGGDVTSSIAWRELRSVKYGDSPGLNSKLNRDSCAQEIEKALKEDGPYKVCFVTSEKGGRCTTEDLHTVECVLEACPSIRNYAVILNRSETNFFDVPGGPSSDTESEDDFQEHRRSYEAGFMKLTAGLPKPNTFYYMPKFEKLTGKKNRIVDLPTDFIGMIQDLQKNVVLKEDVNPIECDWEAVVEQAHKEAEKAKDEAEQARARAAEAVAAEAKAKQQTDRVREEAGAAEAEAKQETERVRARAAEAAAAEAKAKQETEKARALAAEAKQETEQAKARAADAEDAEVKAKQDAEQAKAVSAEAKQETEKAKAVVAEYLEHAKAKDAAAERRFAEADGRLRAAEEKERLAAQAEERLRSAEEAQVQAAEAERRRREEAERQRRAAEEAQVQAAEAERRRRDEAERQRRAAEEAEIQAAEAERHRRAAEEDARQADEAERQRRAAEEQQRQRVQETARWAAEVERQRSAAEEERRQRMQDRKLEEEGRRRLESNRGSAEDRRRWGMELTREERQSIGLL